jgi:hypothetical protein
MPLAPPVTRATLPSSDMLPPLITERNNAADYF